MPRRQIRSDESPLNSLAGKGNHTAIGRKSSGDHIEKRGLAGAVRPNHGENAALLDVEAEAVDRHQAAEALADTVE